MIFDLHRFPSATRRQFCTGVLGMVTVSAIHNPGRTSEGVPTGAATLTQPSVQRAGQFDKPWGVLALAPDGTPASPLLDHGWHTGKRRLRCRWKAGQAALWVSVPAGMPPDEVLFTAVNNTNAPIRLQCTVVWRLRSAPFPAAESDGWTLVPPGQETPLRFRIAAGALPSMDGLLLFLIAAGDAGDVLLSDLETRTGTQTLGTLRVTGAVRAGRPVAVQVTPAVTEPLCLEWRRGDISVWTQRLPEGPLAESTLHRIQLPDELAAGTYSVGLTAAGRRNASSDVSVRVEPGAPKSASSAAPRRRRVMRCDLALLPGSDVGALVDQLEAEALSADAAEAGLQIRVMLRPPTWWVLANRRDVVMHADGWTFSPGVDAEGFSMASLASDAWIGQTRSVLQALLQGVTERGWGRRVTDVCLELPAPPSHRRAADYSTGASARLAGWLAETRRPAPFRANLVPLPERIDPPGLGVYTSDERDVQSYSWRLFHESVTTDYIRQVIDGLPTPSGSTVTVGVPEWPSLWYPYPERWFEAGVKRVERRSAVLMTGGDPAYHPWPVQVALICDEASMRLAPPGSPYGYAGALHLGEALNRIGAPWTVRTIDQLASLPADIKLILVHCLIAPDPPMRRTLQQLIRQGERHVVVIGPAGLVDPVTLEWRRTGPRLLLSLPLEFDNAPGPVGIGAGSSSPIWPRLIGDDEGGLLYSDGAPATSHRYLAGGRLTWCGSPYLGSGILRNWGTAAGIHLYAPDGVSVGFSENSLTVMSRDASEVMLQLPAPRTLHDPLDGWKSAGIRVNCPVVPNRPKRLEVLDI